MKTIACHKCQNIWSFEPPLGRRDTCPQCGNDARVCLNCLHFDRVAYRQCREPQAEWVPEKDQGNFCGYFSAKNQPQSQDNEQTKTLDQLDQLFSGSKPLSKSPVSSGISDELQKFLNRKK